MIAVHTTCLSETIGDDIPQIVEKGTGRGKFRMANIFFMPIRLVMWVPMLQVSPTCAKQWWIILPNPTAKKQNINLIPGYNWAGV
ncbi:MAG: hypothetical protein R2941_09440 [Desulfobacterales bacterium]